MKISSKAFVFNEYSVNHIINTCVFKYVQILYRRGCEEPWHTINISSIFIYPLGHVDEYYSDMTIHFENGVRYS